MKLLVVNGPELNRLGEREPEIYGKTTYQELEEIVTQKATALGFDLEIRQTDSELEFAKWVDEAKGTFSGLILNPARLTHSSQTLARSVRLNKVPMIEVHISNIYSREPWRRTSVVSEFALGVIAGLGVRGYVLAIDALANLLKEN